MTKSSLSAAQFVDHVLGQCDVVRGARFEAQVPESRSSSLQCGTGRGIAKAMRALLNAISLAKWLSISPAVRRANTKLFQVDLLVVLSASVALHHAAARGGCQGTIR